jgi:hypothetical protein
MIAENKRTGNQTEFTLEQWRNLENSGHARYWKIIDAGIIPKSEPIQFSEPVTLTVDYQLKDYGKLLDEAGIEYNKRIKNQLKLKEIYEQNKPVVTTIPDKKGET